MKRIALTIILAACLATPTTAASFPDRPQPTQADHYNPEQTLIIQTDKPVAELVSKIFTKYPSLTVSYTYDTLFHGVAVRGRKRELNRLVEEAEVTAAAPASTYAVQLDDSVSFIGAEASYRFFDSAGRRLTGKGIKVGVIDTGIDYTHRDLRINYKGGFDLIDGDTDPMETQAPKAHATLHGTHVAGIIAANGRLHGVAPDAQILAYRALGPGGIGTSDQVIAAIEKAVEDEVDVLNLSLGNTVNGPDWPTSLALNKAVEHGVIAVTSSGNSGPARWTVGSPGTASAAISVGASSPPLKLPYLTVPLTDKEIALTIMQGSKPWDINREEELVYGGIGEQDELQGVAGKIVLMRRGKITFTEKVKNAEAAGALAAIIFNNEKGGFAGTIEGEVSLAAASLTKADGEWLLSQLKKQGELTVKSSYRTVADQLAPFSSRGPVTETWEIKPDVVAPGVAIDSTVPDGYLPMQGTSMAAPHVAGAAALVKQAHPDWTPHQVKAALMNTAKLLHDERGNVLLPDQQGAGRIAVDRAVRAEALIYPGSLTFQLINQHQLRTRKRVSVTLENISGAPKTFYFNQPEHQSGLQWKLPFAVTVPAHGKTKAEVMLDLQPRVLKPGIHQGFLTVEGGGEQISLPYLFAINEPDYPRLMGFELKADPADGSIMFQIYLPRGADEFGVALYDPDTFAFIRYLHYEENVERGLVKRKVDEQRLQRGKAYKAIIFAKKSQKEDVLEVNLMSQ